MKHSIYYIIIALGFSCLLSCTKEDLGTKRDANALGVSFKPILAAPTVATRATSEDSDAGETFTAGELSYGTGEKSFPILCAVSDIDAPAIPSHDSVATKGALLNDSGTACDLSSKVKTFHVTAWDTKTDSQFIPDKTQVDYNTTDKKWSYSGLSDLTWTYNDEKFFFAYANAEDCGANFSVLQDAKMQILLYNVEREASKHKDVLLGYYKGIGEKNEDGDNVVPLEFFHPLSAVSFKMGNIEGVQKINSIVISGVYYTGYCSQGYSSRFSWNQEACLVDPSITFTLDLQETTTGTDGTLGGDGGHFMFIPQEFSKDQSLTIKVTVTRTGGAEDTFYGKIESGSWEAGKHYVYTLGDNLPVFSIGDDTTITNESAFAAYVRAAVVGNWYDVTDHIVAPWDQSFSAGSGWTKRADGFWYYNTRVAAGESTSSLMSNLTKPPKEGETLKYRILVQGSSVAF